MDPSDAVSISQGGLLYSRVWDAMVNSDCNQLVWQWMCRVVVLFVVALIVPVDTGMFIVSNIYSTL